MIALEIVLLVLMVTINGVFAMSEMAVVSARRVRLQQHAQQGDSGAAAALKLVDKPNRFLSTVQIGITLVGILAGAFGGATLAQEIAFWLKDVPLIGPYAGAISVGAVVVATTYLSLVIGELVPKRLALNNAERIASRIAGPMGVLSVIATPFVRILTLSTEGVLRLLGARASDEPPITEDEITMLIEQGTQAGVFLPDEQQIVERVLRLDARRVSALMRPRTEIVWLDLEDAEEVNREKMALSGHSFFPVGQSRIDRVLGIASVQKLWSQALRGQPLNIAAALEPANYIPETASILNLLSLFREKGQHVALVISEHGGIEGIITLADAMEALIGDFPIKEGGSTPQIVARQDGTWLVDGLLPLEVLRKRFTIDTPLETERGLIETVGGLAMVLLDRVPQETDVFMWGGYQFEVVDMDELRVDKVLVSSKSP